jgi:hypothetical protein
MAPFKHTTIIADLRELIRLLKFHKFDSDKIMEFHNLERLVGDSRNGSNHNYNIEDIVFYSSNSGMKSNPFVKAISIFLKSNYRLVEVLSIKDDMFLEYTLEIFIKGYKDKTKVDDFSFFSWHLDRELNTDGDYIHPYYHFHAGGRHVGDKNPGDLLMISSPRIPHPPMDILLSIHFIILNFLNSGDFKNKTAILHDDDYISIIQRAQQRLLDPYFFTFNKVLHNDYSRHNLFPLYI